MKKLDIYSFSREKLDVNRLEDLVKDIDVLELIKHQSAVFGEIKAVFHCAFDIEKIASCILSNVRAAPSKTAVVSGFDFSNMTDKCLIAFCLAFSNFLGKLTPSAYVYKDYKGKLASIDKSDIPELYEEVVHEANSAVKNSSSPSVVHSDDSFRSQTPDIVGLFGIDVAVKGGESLVWGNEMLLNKLDTDTREILGERFPYVQNVRGGEIIKMLPIVEKFGRMRFRLDRLKVDLLTPRQRAALHQLARVISETEPFILSSLKSGEARFMANNFVLHSRAPYRGTRRLIKTRIFNATGFQN